MRPVSDAWLRTITGSYTPITRVTLVETFQTGRSPIGDRLRLVDGTITLDGQADIYTTGRLTFPGEYWEMLTAPGVELFIETGIRYSDTRVELVPLGYLRVRTPSQQQAHRGGPVTVAVEDRSSTLARAELLRPRVYAANTTYGEMVNDLVREVYPTAVIEWDDDTYERPIGRELVVDQYRLDALQGVAVATGKIMRWDGNGVLKFFSLPSLLGDTPVAYLVHGRGGFLSEVSREISDAQAVNAVVVRGDGTDPLGGAYGVAIDDDPRSPTRYSGPFGPAVKHISSSVVTTDAQALNAAQVELSRSAGLVHAIGFTASPRLELEPDDLVHIEHDYGVGRHRIARLELPLVPGRAMTGLTRQQALTSGGPA